MMKLSAVTRSLFFTALMLGGVVLMPAQTTYTWVGGTSPGNWNKTANWSPATAPNSTSAIALFNVNTSYDPTVNANSSVGELLFQGTANQNLTGTKTLTINGISGIGIDNQVNYTPTFANPFKLNASQTWQATNTSGGGLSFSGAINLNGKELTLNPLNAANTITISSVLSSTGGSLVISGAGTTVLSGSNTYTGGTTVSSGTVQVKNANALSTSGTVTFSGNGTLQSGSAGLTIARAIAVGSGITGTVDTNGNTFTLSGVISGAGGVTKIGTGTLILSGSSNTYTGATAINAGTLQTNAANLLSNSTDVTVASGATYNLNNYSDTVGSIAGAGNITLGTGTLTTAANNSTTFSGVISGTGALSIGGTGTLVLSGSNTYTGGTTISAGTVQVQNNNALGTGKVTFGGNSTLQSGSSGLTVANGIAINSGITGTVDNNGNAFTLSGVISGAGGLTSTGAGTLTLSGTNTYTGTTTVSGGTLLLGVSNAISSSSALVINSGATFDVNWGNSQTMASLSGAGTLNIRGGPFTVGNATSTTFSGVITDGGGYGTFIKQGTGTLTLSGANTYTGLTTISAGAIIAANSSALGAGAYGSSVASGAALELENGITVNMSGLTVSGSGIGGTGVLRNLDSNTNTLTAALTLGASSTFGADAGTLVLTGDTNMGSGQTLTVTGAGNTQFSGALNGSSSLLMTGTGTLTLSGSTANSFSSGLSINSGTVLLNKTAGTNAVGGGAITVGDGVGGAGSAVLRLMASNQIPDYAGTLTLNSDGVFDVNNQTEGINTFAGTGAITLGSTGQLTVGVNSGTSVFSGVISGGGSLTQAGGTVTLSGVNTYTGATTINAGTLTLGINNALSNSTDVTVASGATYNLNNYSDTVGSIAGAGNITLGTGTLTTADNNSTSFSGVMSGTGGFAKGGTGTLTFTGANTYSGATTVGAGTLNIQNAAALGSASTNNVTVSSGATLALQGGITVPDSGQTLTLNGAGASGSNGALVSAGPSGQVNEWDSAISLGSNATIGTADSLLVLGANGSGNTIALGSNTLTFNAASATTVAVPAAVNGSYSTDPSNLFVNEAISGTGGVTKIGAGTLTFFSNGNSYTGNTTITGGKLIIDTSAGSNNGINGNIFVGNSGHTGAANTVILQQGETVQGANSANDVIADTANMTIYEDGLYSMQNNGETFNSLTLQGGHVNEGNLSNPSAGVTLTLNSSTPVTTLASSQTAVIEGGNLMMTKGTSTFNVASGSAPGGVDLQINSIIQDNLAPSGGTTLTKSGAGTLVLTGANTYLGPTVVNQGVLNIQNNSALGQTGTSSGTTVNSGAQLQVQGGLAIGESLTLNGTGVSNTGALESVAGNNSWSGGVTLGSSARINNAAAGSTLTFSGAVNNSGTNQTLTVGGAGNVTFNGAVNLGGTGGTLTTDGTGTVTLNTAGGTIATVNANGGTLVFGANNVISNPAAALSIGAAGTVSLGNTSQTIGALSGSGALVFGGNATLSQLIISQNSAFSGSVTGTGTLIINAGTFTLGAGFNDLNLNIVLNGGTLALNNTSSRLGSLQVNSNSILDFGTGASVAQFSSVNLLSGAQLSITNWANTVDYFYSTVMPSAQGTAPIDQIVFSGYTGSNTKWEPYTNGPYNGHQITPVPEPGVYGAGLLLIAFGFVGLARRRRARV